MFKEKSLEGNASELEANENEDFLQSFLNYSQFKEKEGHPYEGELGETRYALVEDLKKKFDSINAPEIDIHPETDMGTRLIMKVIPEGGFVKDQAGNVADFYQYNADEVQKIISSTEEATDKCLMELNRSLSALEIQKQQLEKTKERITKNSENLKKVLNSN